MSIQQLFFDMATDEALAALDAFWIGYWVLANTLGSDPGGPLYQVPFVPGQR
jgi:hypothetical protein